LIYLLGDLTGLDATGADSQTFRLTIDLSVNRLQVDIEAPVAEIVGLTYVVPHARFLAAYFANLSHHSSKLDYQYMHKKPFGKSFNQIN
jgi:hypothetical protein